jgi:uncharacterized membrane protein
MAAENMEGEGKSNRIWVWLLGIVGGLFTLLGLFSGLMMVGADIHETYEMGFICFTPSLAIGVAFLILFVKVISQKEKLENRRIWGWILVIFGCWLILSTIWLYWIAGFLLYRQPPPEISIGYILVMVTGIVLFILGIWLLPRKKKHPPQI